MGTLYYQSTGATTNSGSSDNNAADLSGVAATVAGSVVSLDGSPDLSGIVTSGAAQSAIYIADATNSNMKIFWITAANNGAKTVTVSVVPTGVTSSAWKIGGRNSDIQTVVNPLRAGDTLIVNDAATISSSLTFRRSGDTTSGSIKIVGKSGTRPVLTQTGSGQQVISDGGFNWICVENLEAVQSHASSGNALMLDTGNNNVAINVKVSDSPERGIKLARWGACVACEVYGFGTVGVQFGAGDCKAIGTYVHDGTGAAFDGAGNSRHTLINNIADTVTGAAFTGAAEADVLYGNTAYNVDGDGWRVTPATGRPILINNIAMDCGNAGTEFGINLTAGVDSNCTHTHNLVNIAGGRGGGTFSANITVGSTESTSNPSFTNASGGDFSLGSSSPAKATGFPGAFISGSTGYMDMGAVQRQEAGGGSGGVKIVGRGGLAG